MIGSRRKIDEGRAQCDLVAEIDALAKARVGTRFVEILQRALVRTSGLDAYEVGHFDMMTQNAFARWQRQIGYAGADADGIPNRPSLERLARETGIFTLAAEN